MYITLIIVSRFISKASTKPIMESKVRVLMPKSLRYLKKIYHCHVTINVKAFPPFQPRINATKTEQLDNLQALPSAKLRHQLVPFFG